MACEWTGRTGEALAKPLCGSIDMDNYVDYDSYKNRER